MHHHTNESFQCTRGLPHQRPLLDARAAHKQAGAGPSQASCLLLSLICEPLACSSHDLLLMRHASPPHAPSRLVSPLAASAVHQRSEDADALIRGCSSRARCCSRAQREQQLLGRCSRQQPARRNWSSKCTHCIFSSYSQLMHTRARNRLLPAISLACFALLFSSRFDEDEV